MRALLTSSFLGILVLLCLFAVLTLTPWQKNLQLLTKFSDHRLVGENLLIVDHLEEKDTNPGSELAKIMLDVNPSPSPLLSLAPLPTQKTLASGSHAFQTFNNCGPASLSMALSYFEITATQQELGNALRPYQNLQGDNDDKSVTLAELAVKAQEYDLLTYHRPGGNLKIIQNFIAEDIPVITRTWTKPNEDIGHYRVVKGYDQSQNILIQDDSLQGKNLSYTIDEFNQLWQAFNYEFLVLVPPEKKAIAETILGDQLDEKTAWELALQQAQAQVSQTPTDIYAQFNLLTAHYHLGNYQATVTIFEQVQDRLPERMLWYQLEPLLAYYQLGQDDRVLSLTQEILANHNRAFSELHYLRGQIFRKRGQTIAANEAFKLAEQYNQHPYWQTNLPDKD
jgi:predicted double-glycine peptidase